MTARGIGPTVAGAGGPQKTPVSAISIVPFPATSKTTASKCRTGASSGHSGSPTVFTYLTVVCPSPANPALPTKRTHSMPGAVPGEQYGPNA